MKTLLFHKMIINNKVYYQCVFVVDTFIKSSKFDPFELRKQSDKGDFYMEIDDKDLDPDVLHKIYREGKYLEEVVEEQELLHVADLFDSEMQRQLNIKGDVRSLTPYKYQDSYAKLLGNDVFYQDEVVNEVMRQILLNGYIARSEMTDQQKMDNHENIVLYGPHSSGKRTLMDALVKHLNVPVAKTFVQVDPQIMMHSIARSLAACNSKDFKRGVVILNTDNLDILNSIGFLNSLSGNDVIYHDYEHDIHIDFRDLTFIINVDYDEELGDTRDEIDALIENTNFTCSIEMNPLTIEQQVDIILRNKHSYLYLYRQIAKNYGKQILISEQALTNLVIYANENGYGLQEVQVAIADLIKEQLIDRNKPDIRLDNRMVEYFKENIVNIVSEAAKPQNKTFQARVEEMTQQITKQVRCQDKQIRRIVRQILRNQRYIEKPGKTGNRKKNILLRGDSGCGKTFIMKCIKELIGVPMVLTDATKYTEEGYIGRSVSHILELLIKEAGGNIELAQHGIVYIDEIDKKGEKGGDNGSSGISREAVQNSLLTMLEGEKVEVNLGTISEPNNVTFDTKDLTFISGGAFEGIEKLRDARVRKERGAAIGFGNQKEVNPTTKAVSIDDYVAFGMSRQFIARHVNRVTLNKLKENDIRDIIVNSQSSAVKQLIESYEEEGLKVEFTEDFIDEFAKRVFLLKAGARGIDEATAELSDNLGLDDIDTKVYGKVIINKDCLDNPSALQLIERKKRKIKS